MNNNNTRTKNKRSSVLNKLRSITIKNFKKNTNHNKNEEEKLKKEKEEKILNIGYYLLAEIMYYDMSKSEQERVQKLGFTSHHRGIPKGKNIEFIKKLQGYKSYFTTNVFSRNNVPLKYKGYSRWKLETDYNLNDNSGIIILYNKKFSKEYDGIIYLFIELKTKGELNEEAIELGTESYGLFPYNTLIMKKYEKENKENKEREMKEYNEKKKKNKEESEEISRKIKLVKERTTINIQNEIKKDYENFKMSKGEIINNDESFNKKITDRMDLFVDNLVNYKPNKGVTNLDRFATGYIANEFYGIANKYPKVQDFIQKYSKYFTELYNRIENQGIYNSKSNIKKYETFKNFFDKYEETKELF